MEGKDLLKIGYEAVIIINGIAVILWIFLGIFPGYADLYLGNISEGLQDIFLNIWLFCFVITLGIGIFLRFLLKGEQSK